MQEREDQQPLDLQKKMARYVAMVAVVPPEPAVPQEVGWNGTVSLLELPKGKFLVTNHHVWRDYQADRLEQQGLRLVVMGHGLMRPVDISTATLVDWSEDYDLAILRFAGNDIIEKVGKKFYKPKTWPMARPKPGEEVVFTGFPGARKRREAKYVWHESVMLAMKAVAVGLHRVTMRYENPSPEILTYSPFPLDADLLWGGMSGSLVYRLNEEASVLDASAVLFGGSEKGGTNNDFFATCIDVINEDGTLRR